jgi:hypothetical protein
MREFVSAICAVGALLLIAASMMMNWSFWTGQGAEALNAQVFGAVSLGIDGFKATLPLVIYWTWLQKFRFGYVIATLFFCGCLGFSFFSAIGFASSSRSAVTGTREANALRYAAAEQDLTKVEERLRSLGSARPQRVVEEAIGKAEQDRRWSSSSECREATTESARNYCRGLSDLRIELATSAESDRLLEQQSSLKAEIDRLMTAGARLEQDPQAGVLARLSGWPTNQVQTFLVVLFALLVELGAAFGLFLAMLPLRGLEWFDRISSVGLKPSVQILPPLAKSRKASERPTRFVRAADGQLMIE